MYDMPKDRRCYTMRRTHKNTLMVNNVPEDTHHKVKSIIFSITIISNYPNGKKTGRVEMGLESFEKLCRGETVYLP